MSQTEIIVLVLAFAALGFSLYKKYIRKDQSNEKPGRKNLSGSSFAAHSKDDDYEPYRNK